MNASRMRNSVQESCPCIYNDFFLIRDTWMNKNTVRETWSHVIEMLHCCWLEVGVVNADETIIVATAKLSLSSATFLVRATCMVVYATCI